MPPSLLDLYRSLTTQNWFASAAFAILVATQILKSHPALRALTWSKVPVGYRWAVPVLSAGLAAFVHGFQAHEAFSASAWDALKIALSAMGAAAALKESPIPWSGGSGGAPFLPASRSVPPPPPPPPPQTPAILHAVPAPPARQAADDDKTPIDGHRLPPFDPPPAA